uniref:hypothetical protein n=1 Tax=Eubacterium cellulosolvens TaxID=29322 RepID=UPI000489B028|nr:hypothetical protein [[Eubacterium] cellulosolvens]
MPQINKIRIVNFSYNDGNRFIPDELYDLSSGGGEALNSLFNLNNGGGKTVLVQLMMQPVHPRAMAGGRRIEDYFGRPGDHSFVLLEWNLDGSDNKLLTGIAIAGSTAAGGDEKQRGNSIRYYTFKTIYDNSASPYSIAAMELSANEKGKYVPASFEYVREKAKNSRGMLEYYSSDDSVKWAKELAAYGIFRSEWETVIEALNKDEGGLNQYFDEAKTSDKLISKFFIPAIENKMKSAEAKGTDSSLETMLINYAKKISEKENVIRERDTNRKLLGSLSGLEEQSRELYKSGEELADGIGEVCAFKAAVGRKNDELGENILNKTREVQLLEEQIRHIEHEERSKEFYLAGEEFDASHLAFSKAGQALEQAREEESAKKHDEDVLQSARLHSQILCEDSDISSYKTLIEEKENNSEDAEAVAKLKYSVYVKAGQEKAELTQKLREMDQQISQQKEKLQAGSIALEKSEKEKDAAVENYARIRAKLEVSKENTDARAEALGLAAMRMLDGFYSGSEIEEERKQKEEEREMVSASAAKIREERSTLEERKNAIPEELADVKLSLGKLETVEKQAEAELSLYGERLEELIQICDKYSLEAESVFSGRLGRVLQEETETTAAAVRKQQQDRQSLEDRLKAAGEGHVHIFSDIMKYVISTGLSYQTGEEYLTALLENGALTGEKVEEILTAHPEFAFSLLFNNEKDLAKLLSAGNVDWLPATVPLFTMEQVNELMEGRGDAGSHLAVYDKTYFSDRAGYCDRLEAEIREKDERLKRLQEKLSVCEAEKKQADDFSYPEDWKALQEKKIQELQEKEGQLEEKRKSLEEELERTKEQMIALEKELESCRQTLQKLEKWLESFEELENMLSREKEWYDRSQEAYGALKKAENHYLAKQEEHKKAVEALSELENQSRQQAEYLAYVETVLENVDTAKETEIQEGTLEELYSGYRTLSGNLSESLEQLRQKLAGAQKNKAGLEKELADNGCERTEYEAVRFSPEALKIIRDAFREASGKREKAQAVYVDCNAREAAARQRREASERSLEEFEGKALPQNEIGADFKKRIRAARQEIRKLEELRNALGEEKRALERIYDSVGIVLKPYQSVERTVTVELSGKPEAQWQGLHDHLLQKDAVFKKLKEKMLSGIREIVGEYRNIALFEIVNKLGAIGEMLEDSGIRGDRLFTVSESIGAMVASIEKINSKIETDLKEIENDFNDIVDQCMNQGKRMYLDLRMIAASSRAHIFEGKPQTQMVKMNLPEEKEISEEASRISIRTEIEQGANEIRELLRNEAEEKQIRKRARAIVSSERLLHKYIRQESIQIKVFKIDMNSANSVYKRWEDTLTQSSGAEKFVVFFSVVLTLMNYTRSSAGLVSRNIRSVLILDNPFGKITSAHLLKPMFDIAKHFHVQLICLSDINKSDVVGCFDCVIKLVIKAQSLSNFEVMTHEGNERIEHGYYKIMNGQMSLF